MNHPSIIKHMLSFIIGVTISKFVYKGNYSAIEFCLCSSIIIGITQIISIIPINLRFKNQFYKKTNYNISFINSGYWSAMQYVLIGLGYIILFFNLGIFCMNRYSINNTKENKIKNEYVRRGGSKNSVSDLSEKNSNSVQGRIKKSIKNIISQYTSENSKAINFAMLLGDRSLLKKDFNEKLRRSGVIHLFAVSGFHVIIIYFFIGFILGVFSIKIIQKIKPLLSMAFLVFYSMIVGATSSIIRATVFFAIYQLMKSSKRLHNQTLVLVMSAYIQLLMAPNKIYELSFQLSYLAVMGILYIHPYISNFIMYFFGIKSMELLKGKSFSRSLLRGEKFSFYSATNILKNKLVNYLIISVSISISTQITTGPLIIYYFKKFPVYFIISNLLAIPFAFLIINSAMLIVILFALIYSVSYALSNIVGIFNDIISADFNQWLCNFFVKLILKPIGYSNDFFIKIFEIIIDKISNLPNAYLVFCKPKISDILLLYWILLFGILMIRSRNIIYLGALFLISIYRFLNFFF